VPSPLDNLATSRHLRTDLDIFSYPLISERTIPLRDVADRRKSGWDYFHECD